MRSDLPMASVFDPGDAQRHCGGIRLGESAFCELWSLQPSDPAELSRFAERHFAEMPQDEALLENAGWRLFRLWPHKSLLRCDLALDAEIKRDCSFLTEVGHGMVELELLGAAALEFVNLYVAVELIAVESGLRALRCRLGQYSVLIYWNDPGRVMLLVERSCAWSCRDYLLNLLSRWSQENAQIEA